MKITTSAMMMYMALFTSRELTVRRLSAADMALKLLIQACRRFCFLTVVSDMILSYSDLFIHGRPGCIRHTWRRVS